MGRTKLFLAAAVLAALLVSAKSQEVEDQHEFSYDPHSENGPHNWGKIHEEWAVCGKGEMQSPIDLSDNPVQINPLLGPLRQAYRPAEAVLKNRGHDIMAIVLYQKLGSSSASILQREVQNSRSSRSHAPSKFYTLKEKDFLPFPLVSHQLVVMQIEFTAILLL